MSSELPSAVVTLKKRRALPFFSKHPWVFAGAIDRVEGDPQPGSEVVVRASGGEFIARGLFNPDSNIRVRLYTWTEAEPLDADFWRRRVNTAIDLRDQLYDKGPAAKACRLVFSEGDGLSGLTVDRYDDWLMVQWTSRALYSRQEEILAPLCERVQPKGIWMRTERGIGEAEGLEASDGLIRGEEPPRPLFIEENGLRYGIDVVEGQKTGFYFDQRENRLAAARYAQGRRALDAFCYTGGFALNALQHGGAAHATGVDSSGPAIETARANAELNGLGARCEFLRSDVSQQLEQFAGAGRKFGLVVLDPPKMARNRAGLERAAKGYARLNRLGLELLDPGGILVTCSCSGLMEREMFLDVLARAALDAGRTLQILEQRGQTADHPVSVHCREGSYLKCVIARAV
jgi:23S rRNA (cytosine1962-C5)-methyltransferase